MRSLLFVVVSFAVTIFCWGIYGPVLHWGQADMVTEAGRAAGMKYARLRPFVCVGLAYFAIGVIVPAILLKLRGEQGAWTTRGALLSLLAGALGAVGAMGIIMAFNFGGDPVYVMPLVFGGAPVVNSFLTIWMGRRMKEIGPLFTAGLVMVLIGSVTVLLTAPSKPKPATAEATVPIETQRGEAHRVEATLASHPAPQANGQRPIQIPTAALAASGPVGGRFSQFVLRLLSIAATILCWGAYGPTLHKGQTAMGQSRLRPLLCVGLAYFAIAVLVPNLLLAVTDEPSTYNFSGTLWSLAAGAAGAIGALGIILAFNFGGKPIYVMPLVFGGAPVVNTLATTLLGGMWDQIRPIFLSGLILVVAGAAMVLVFAPKGGPPPKSDPPPPEPRDQSTPKSPAEVPAASGD
jgi:gas vesicle protein